MAMSSYFCTHCNRTVQDGTSHCCYFYENDDLCYNLEQLDEIEEFGINRYKTTAIYAANFDDKNGNTRETAQEIGNSSQTSTSLVHSDFSIENKELEGGWFGELLDSADRPFAQDSSFYAPERMRILDAGADKPLKSGKVTSTVPGPSTIHQQTRGPEGMKVYVCDKCSYQCKYESHFKRHYKKHTGEKNHVCETCGKRFAEKGYLNKHQITHTEEKPHRCEICGKDFARKQTLDSHLKTHTGKWPYVCQKCEKGFSRRGHLDIHLRTHTGERPFECPICNRRFSNPSNFGIHVATGCRGPYRCGQCEQTFSCNEDRNRHTMQEHP